MTILAGMLALVPVWLLGFAAQRALGIRRAGIEGAVGDYAGGVALLGIVGTVLVLANRLSIWPVYGLLLVLCVAALGRVSRHPRGPIDRAPPGLPPHDETGARFSASRWAAVAAGAAAVVVLVLLATATTDRLSWDGWAIWSLRARILFVEGGLPAVVYQKPGPLDFAHPEYPLAVPLLDWWLFRHAGGADTALASFAGGIWIAGLVALLWSGLRRGGPALWAGLAALAVALFRPISQYAVGGTADVVMALAVLGAVIELREAALSRAAEDDGRDAWLRAALYLTLGALAKNEGAAAAVAAVLGVMLWSLGRRKRPPLHALALLAPLLIAAAWQLHVRSWGLDVEQIGGIDSGGGLMVRAGLIVSHLGGLAVHRSWPPVAGILALGVWASIRHRAPDNAPGGAPRGGPELWLVLGYFGAVLAVYLSTMHSLEWLLDTSLDRVMTHLVPAGVFLALLAAAPRAVPPRC